MPLSRNALAAFGAAKEKSERGIEEMREEAARMFQGDASIVVGLNGSYARREVTTGSDVDLFFLYKDQSKETAQDSQERLRRKLKRAGYIMPASNGVFDDPLSINTLQRRIGGMEDDNLQITRRMLLLLEGEWVFNREEFEEIRLRLLKQYVPNTLREDQICLFLLNDVIRYWRTICVDFEFKVRNDGKARAIRLLKLRFSRMLLFFAGVLAIGETYNKNAERKLMTLNSYLSLPAIDRMRAIACESATPALELYAEFLMALDEKEIREVLSAENGSGEQSEEFGVLRTKAQDFRDALLSLLNAQFGGENPTVNALML